MLQPVFLFFFHQLRQQSHRRRTRDGRDIKITNVPTSSDNTMESSCLSKLRESGNGGNVLLPLKSHSLNKEYICSCGKHFKTLQKFTVHRSAHTSEPTTQPLYACEICNKEFSIRSSLYQHLVTHDNERKHKCTMCTKSFKRLAGLNQVTKIIIL